MQQIGYENFSGFTDVYLEDSYVLGIDDASPTVAIDLAVVLNEKHPLYKKPPLDEQYCYRNARVIFPNCREVNWVEKSIFPYKDATGEIDYGNIDSFVLIKGRYKIDGDWGRLDIVSDPPILEIPDES